MVELILLDLKKKLEKEKGLRSRVLLKRAIDALNDYHESRTEKLSDSI